MAFGLSLHVSQEIIHASGLSGGRYLGGLSHEASTVDVGVHVGDGVEEGRSGGRLGSDHTCRMRRLTWEVLLFVAGGVLL